MRDDVLMQLPTRAILAASGRRARGRAKGEGRRASRPAALLGSTHSALRARRRRSLVHLQRLAVAAPDRGPSRGRGRPSLEAVGALLDDLQSEPVLRVAVVVVVPRRVRVQHPPEPGVGGFHGGQGGAGPVPQARLQLRGALPPGQGAVLVPALRLPARQRPRERRRLLGPARGRRRAQARLVRVRPPGTVARLGRAAARLTLPGTPRSGRRCERAEKGPEAHEHADRRPQWAFVAPPATCSRAPRTRRSPTPPRERSGPNSSSQAGPGRRRAPLPHRMPSSPAIHQDSATPQATGSAAPGPRTTHGLPSRPATSPREPTIWSF